MLDQLKLMAKVIVLGISPMAISIAVAMQFDSDDDQVFIVMVGGILSLAVVFWIFWFWGEEEPDEEAADQ